MRFVKRCRNIQAALSSGLCLSCLFMVVVLMILFLTPVAKAGPIVVDDRFDFQTGPLGWTATPVGKNGQLPPTTNGMRWTHSGTEWRVNWAPVGGPLAATGNYLTSPPISASAQADGALIDALRISIAHKFNFSSSINGVPPAAGQLAYSMNGGPFVGVAASAFQTGLVTVPDPVFGVSPLVGPPSLVDQASLVTASFVPPVGLYSDLFPLVNGGASFTGSTVNYSNTGGAFVPSVATLFFAPTLITDFRIRLINANLGSNCPADAGWDVRFVQVDFLAPEPSSFALAGLGALCAGAAYARRRTVNNAPRDLA